MFPVISLGRIEIENTSICPDGMMMRALNCTKIATLGEIDLMVLIRPCEFEIQLHILVVFNSILGQPWIHTVGATPCSLHQKVKFISRSKLIFVMTEEDLTVPFVYHCPVPKA